MYIFNIHLRLQSGSVVTWEFGYCPRWDRLGQPKISQKLLGRSGPGTLGIVLSRTSEDILRYRRM